MPWVLAYVASSSSAIGPSCPLQASHMWRSDEAAPGADSGCPSAAGTVWSRGEAFLLELKVCC